MYSVLGSLVDVVSVRDIVSGHGVLGVIDVVIVVGDLAFGVVSVVSAVSVLGVSVADVVIALGEVSVVSVVGDSQCTQC